MTEMSKCPFCGLHPYEYVDVGLGGRGVAVAVNCCHLGPLLFDQRGPEKTVYERGAEYAEQELAEMAPGDEKLEKAMQLIEAYVGEHTNMPFSGSAEIKE